MKKKLLSNLEKLDIFELFEDNWDGYGAQKFTKELIDYCKDIVKTLPYQPDIFPTGRGSIQMEYEIGDDYLEFEIYEDKTIHLFQIWHKKERETTVDIDMMKEAIRLFHIEQGELKWTRTTGPNRKIIIRRNYESKKETSSSRCIFISKGR